jgi:CTP synthase
MAGRWWTRSTGADRPVTIAIVGKYVNLRDAYLSVIEALSHGGFRHGADVESGGSRPTTWLERRREELDGVDGDRVPGGFGVRGVEGKLEAARYARERGVPVPRALPGPPVRGDRVRPPRLRSGRRELVEFDPRRRTRDRPAAGAEGRDGHGRHDAARSAALLTSSRAPRGTLLRARRREERHRHRWRSTRVPSRRCERRAGPVGLARNGRLAEIIELPDHPFFIAGQFHREAPLSAPPGPSRSSAWFPSARAQTHRRGLAPAGNPSPSAAPERRRWRISRNRRTAEPRFQGNVNRLDVEEQAGAIRHTRWSFQSRRRGRPRAAPIERLCS